MEVEIPGDAGPDVWRDDRARDLGFVTDVNATNGMEDVEGGYGFGGRGTEKEKEKEKKKKEKKRKEEKWGDKVRLRSEVVPGATGYYSGVIRDGEPESLLKFGIRLMNDIGALHLHPISQLHQLRTSLSYLDDYDTQIRERAISRKEREEQGENGGEKKPKVSGAAQAPNRTTKVWFLSGSRLCFVLMGNTATRRRGE